MNMQSNFCTDNYNYIDEVLIAKRGFLHKENPLKRLPDTYIYWEKAADILPEIISSILDKNLPDKKSNYSYAINILEKMPQYEINNLVTTREKQRAILLLGIFAHIWIWLPYVAGMSDRPEQFIPKQISVPLYQLSKLLSRPPVLTNSDLFDYNWQQNFSNEEMNINNVALHKSFWYIDITVHTLALVDSEKRF